MLNQREFTPGGFIGIAVPCGAVVTQQAAPRHGLRMVEGDFAKRGSLAIQLKDLSVLRWTDTADTMVVTFGEVADGARTGTSKRQYWVRQGQQWKIFYEGVTG